jgi:hypothetical protein
LRFHFGLKTSGVLFRQGLEQRNGLVIISFALAERKPLTCLLAGLHPTCCRLRNAPRALVVASQQLRLGLRDFGEPLNHGLGDLIMELLPGLAQERLIGGVLDERVTKLIRRCRRRAVLRNQLQFHHPLESGRQRLGRHAEHILKQFETGFPADGCGCLCHGPVRSQPINARHQRVLHAGRNQARGQRPGELVTVLQLAQET